MFEMSHLWRNLWEYLCQNKHFNTHITDAGLTLDDLTTAGDEIL